MGDEIDDIEDEYVLPYDCSDPRNESPPDHVVYSSIHSQLETSFAEVAMILDAPLKTSDFRGAVVDSLQKDISRRTNAERKEEVTFAVSGDMASGKSSVINSILSSGMLARKGASGGSCTWVVQRFRKMFPNQEKPFAAEVHFFDQAKIREILKAHLAKYYNASRKTTTMEGGDDEEEDVSTDLNDIGTVLDAFMPLFSQAHEFRDVESARSFLGRAQSEDDAETLDWLVTEANEGIGGLLQGDTCIRIGAHTSGELLGRLEQFPSTIDGDEGRELCQPWLLVEVVDIGLDIPILNDGFVFVDAPGTSDANTTRAENARSYHQKCSHRIYVANISRAIDDKSLREAKVNSYRRRGSRNLIVVLTHSDNIDDETIVRGNKLVKQWEQKLREDIKSLISQRNGMRSKRQRVSEDGQATSMDQTQVMERIKQAERDLRSCRLRMRNNDTKMTLQRKYKEQSGDPHLLPVFVVDNEQYKIHQAGYIQWHQHPTMDVVETGVPALRKQIYLLPAEGKLNESLHVANHQIPSLINAVELYCAKSHLTRQEDLEEIIVQPKSGIDVIIHRLQCSLKCQVRSILLEPMMAQQHAWLKGARQLCVQWRKKYAPKEWTVILKNRGYRKGFRGNKDIEWHEALLSINKNAMQGYFTELQLSYQDCFEVSFAEIVKLLDNCKNAIKKDQQFNFMAIRPLIESLDHARHAARQSWDKLLRDLGSLTGDIENNILGLPREGIFYEIMLPIYKSACEYKSFIGAPVRRIEEFQNLVGKHKNVWVKYNDKIAERFWELLKKYIDTLGNKMRPIFDGIHRDFRRMCDDTTNRSEEEKLAEEKLIAELSKAVVKARSITDGPMRALADECKNYEKKRAEDALFMDGDD